MYYEKSFYTFWFFVYWLLLVMQQCKSLSSLLQNVERCIKFPLTLQKKKHASILIS